MYVGAKGASFPSALIIVEFEDQALQPGITRVDRAIVFSRLGRRRRDEPLRVGVAANHPVERDHVSVGCAVCNLDEISLKESNARSVSTLLRFLASGVDVGGGRVDVDGGRGSRREQLVMDDTDAAADIEQ